MKYQVSVLEESQWVEKEVVEGSSRRKVMKVLRPKDKDDRPKLVERYKEGLFKVRAC